MFYLRKRDREEWREPESCSTWRFLKKFCFSYFPWKEISISISIPKKRKIGEETLPRVLSMEGSCTLLQMRSLVMRCYWAIIQLWEGTECYYIWFYHCAAVGLCCGTGLCLGQSQMSRDSSHWEMGKWSSRPGGKKQKPRHSDIETWAEGIDVKRYRGWEWSDIHKFYEFPETMFSRTKICI